MSHRSDFVFVFIMFSVNRTSLTTKRIQENVCVEAVGYLLEELRNPATLEAFRKDVESANMFIGSLIFVQEVGGVVFGGALTS